MAEKSASAEGRPDGTAVPGTGAAAAAPAPATVGVSSPTPPPPRRSPGHRGADVRDTVAEMAAKAQEISLEAGSKMAAAMKDVISAAAGLTGFAIESARDLVQYMVRRGQMTQEEADKLIQQAEAGHAARGGVEAVARAAVPPAVVSVPESPAPATAAPVAPVAPAAAARKGGTAAPARAAAKGAAAKAAPKPAQRGAAKKVATRTSPARSSKTPARAPAKKGAAKSTSKKAPAKRR